MKTILIFFVLSIISGLTFAQKDTINWHYGPKPIHPNGITIGLQGIEQIYGEIGYFKTNLAGYPVVATTLNSSLEFSYIDQLIIAPKIQGRINFAGTINFLASALFYSNLKEQHAAVLRPEIGCGLWFFDLTYGYNFNLYNNQMNQINNHLFSVRYYLNLKK